MTYEPTATINVHHNPEPGSWCAPDRPDSDGEPISLLVASASPSDPLAASLARAWSGTTILPPPTPTRAIDRLRGRTSAANWIAVPIAPPEYRATIRLPNSLMSATTIWSVTNLDLVSTTGPFVLDLLATCVHPADRAKLATTGTAEDTTTDINLAKSLAGHVIGITTAHGSLIATTIDPIAAELFALALADDLRPHDAMLTGPWEERVVQRATELQLGVQIPDQITVQRDLGLPSPIEALIARTCSRIGVVLR